MFAADRRGVAVYDVAASPIRRLKVAETAAESLDLAFLGDGELAVATRSGIDRYAVRADGALIPLANYPDDPLFISENARDVAVVATTCMSLQE